MIEFDLCWTDCELFTYRSRSASTLGASQVSGTSLSANASPHRQMGGLIAPP